MRLQQRHTIGNGEHAKTVLRVDDVAVFRGREGLRRRDHHQSDVHAGRREHDAGIFDGLFPQDEGQYVKHIMTRVMENVKISV